MWLHPLDYCICDSERRKKGVGISVNWSFNKQTNETADIKEKMRRGGEEIYRNNMTEGLSIIAFGMSLFSPFSPHRGDCRRGKGECGVMGH